MARYLWQKSKYRSIIKTSGVLFQPIDTQIVAIKSVITMPKVLDMGMSDEEYLQLIAQGREPAQEQILVRNLVNAGVPQEEAYQVAPLLKKLDRSSEEEALVKKVWQRVRSQ